MTARPTPRPRQRGAALLLAMIIVTLISTLAVSMVWQQWRAVQVETAERVRAQSAWILSGALDWAGLILKEDARPTSGTPVDHLGEPWAVPLAEARLSTFLAADSDNTDDAPDVFLSGGITDAQARFNLTNLTEVVGGKVIIVQADLEVLQRLCENVNVPATVAQLIANGLKNASAPAGTPGVPEDPPLKPRRISQLTWLGIDPQAVQRLEPHIVMLPVRTFVNINTASREVIAAAIKGFNIGDAERLVQYRQRTPFRKLADIQSQFPAVTTEDLRIISVASNYFEVRGRLRLADRVLEQRSLVDRSNRTINVLSSERVNSNDSGR